MYATWSLQRSCNSSFHNRTHTVLLFSEAPLACLCSINAVIRSLKFAPDDIIFMLDIGYGSIKKLALWVGEQTGARVIVASIRVSELTSVSDFMRAVREAMPLSGVTLAVFDHITSNSAIVLPVSELVALAHERGARVLIDGEQFAWICMLKFL